MGCLLDSGHARGCKNSASGVYAFYIGNMPSGTTTSLDYLTKDVDGKVTALNGLTTSVGLYEFVPEKSSSKWDTEINASQEFGSVTYIQKATMVFAGLSQEMQNQVKVLTAGSFVVIVKAKSGKFFLLGENDSISVSGGGASTGQKAGELSGYNLEFSAEEGNPAPEVESAAVAAAIL